MRCRAEWQAEYLLGTGGTQAHRVARRQRRGRLDDRAGFATADVEDQPRGALDRAPGTAEVDAALEAVRGIGDEAVAPRPTGNRLRREEGRFEEQFARRQRDATLLAAHDAGHGQRLGVVGDHQHVAVDVRWSAR